MTTFEYKVIPAPAKGKKARGVKGPEARFAFALESAMNDMAAGGWEYLRAETLPNEERVGLTGSQTHFRTILVFRRPRQDDISAFEPKLLESPTGPEETTEEGATENAPSETPQEKAASQTETRELSGATAAEAEIPEASADDEAGDAALPMALRNRVLQVETGEESSEDTDKPAPS